MILKPKPKNNKQGKYDLSYRSYIRHVYNIREYFFYVDWPKLHARELEQWRVINENT